MFYRVLYSTGQPCLLRTGGVNLKKDCIHVLLHEDECNGPSAITQTCAEEVVKLCAPEEPEVWELLCTTTGVGLFPSDNLTVEDDLLENLTATL